MPFGGHALESEHRYGALTRWADRPTGAWVSGTPFNVMMGFHNCTRLTIGLSAIVGVWTQPITLDVAVRFSGAANYRQLASLLVAPTSQYLSAPLYIVGQDVRVTLTSNAADDAAAITAQLILMASA
jgi:hypothetical protein